ncbi:uracil-DNA glycosylase [Nibricoccus aquaticus]|uniref:Uracil-DNA glycosylase n=1 Tax=Nibricoccus aquaticus TaxID=2576891 RepID=A0A290QCI9_9BACT|nr:uracil-DNA glycosylase [Nibricoccus aquaticus]ATC66244.1 uracil-DNA glycosylase [Nibricoccus aquaticus]
MIPEIPVGWREAMSAETEKDYFRALDEFLEAELAAGAQVLPGRDDIFAALALTELAAVKVVVLGQDPYPTPGHAHGLCFSVRPEVKPIPGSLRNIYKELAADVGFVSPGHGCLEAWAGQGVLLLNTVMTVRAGEAAAHQKRGWEEFTDRVIDAVNAKSERVVFVLWGRHAQKKRERVTNPVHTVVECAHPSPLSARLFLGCRCFSKINALLAEGGRAPVVWQLPPIGELGV